MGFDKDDMLVWFRGLAAIVANMQLKRPELID